MGCNPASCPAWDPQGGGDLWPRGTMGVGWVAPRLQGVKESAPTAWWRQGEEAPVAGARPGGQATTSLPDPSLRQSQ